VTRAPSDLEGWAQLCPACLGKAGTNPFLRARLREALAERGRAGAAAAPRPAAPAARPRPGSRPPAKAFPDDWFLRRGEYEQGAIHDAAWAAELDVATRWLDGQHLRGRIDEPAAGTGFFSPLLADTGELHASDEDGDALDLARDRLVAHRLRAHLHVADPWAVTDPGAADAVVASFLTGRVRGAGLDRATASLRERLRPGGRLALLDLRVDPHGGPPADVPWTWHDPLVLEASLARAGFERIDAMPTGRFFLLVAALAR
jgi:SAM-dependent methyltransferase